MPVKATAASNGTETVSMGTHPDAPLTKFKTMPGLLVLIVLLAGLGVSIPVSLSAHGALLEYAHAAGITVQARYDTGQVMAGAQVTVYAPDNPTRPWLTGICDDAGRFSFVPDPGLPGIWSVQARLAGHGAMAHMTINPEQPEHNLRQQQGYTGGQRALMAACVLWGCIGTALYFSRRKVS